MGLSSFFLGRKDGNGMDGAVVLAAVILHAHFNFTHHRYFFPVFVFIFDDIRGTDSGTYAPARICADAFYFIKDKL